MLHTRRVAARVATVVALAVTALAWSAASAQGKPAVELMYAQGGTYYMITPHFVTNPSPAELAQAEELYLLAYPVAPGTTGPITLPSGYQPHCNPCFHPGLPTEFVYHDHLVSGAPGLGKEGTAGEMKGPWRLIILAYDPAVVADPAFRPLTSVDAVKAGEAAGMFLPINPGAENPYEVETGIIVICPIVSSHA